MRNIKTLNMASRKSAFFILYTIYMVQIMAKFSKLIPWHFYKPYVGFSKRKSPTYRLNSKGFIQITFEFPAGHDALKLKRAKESYSILQLLHLQLIYTYIKPHTVCIVNLVLSIYNRGRNGKSGEETFGEKYNTVENARRAFCARTHSSALKS